MKSLLDLLIEQDEQPVANVTDADLANALAALIVRAHLLSEQYQQTEVLLPGEQPQDRAELEGIIERMERIIAVLGGPASDFAKSLRDYLLRERPQALTPVEIEQELSQHRTRTLITRDEKTGEVRAEEVPAAVYEQMQRQRAEVLQRERQQPPPRRTWADSASDVYEYLKRAARPDHERGGGWMGR
jgi:hypothetical protein